MLFLAVKRVHHSLGNNKWGDTHDTPVLAQLILCKEENNNVNKVAIYKKMYYSHATSKSSSSLEVF